MAGVDISGKSLDVARVRNPEIAYHHSADNKLPFVNGSFNMMFAMCVWHHVPPNQWTTFLSDFPRVLVTKDFSRLQAQSVESFNPAGCLPLRV